MKSTVKMGVFKGIKRGTKIKEEMNKIINLERSLKNINQSINYKLFKTILIRKKGKCE